MLFSSWRMMATRRTALTSHSSRGRCTACCSRQKQPWLNSSLRRCRHTQTHCSSCCCSPCCGLARQKCRLQRVHVHLTDPCNSFCKLDQSACRQLLPCHLSPHAVALMLLPVSMLLLLSLFLLLPIGAKPAAPACSCRGTSYLAKLAAT